HRLPSGPVTMTSPGTATAYWVMSPGTAASVGTRSTWLPVVTHIAPSGPAQMLYPGSPDGRGIRSASVIEPSVPIRPTRPTAPTPPEPKSVNHSLPSGPTAIPRGVAWMPTGAGIGYSVIVAVVSPCAGDSSATLPRQRNDTAIARSRSTTFTGAARRG